MFKLDFTVNGNPKRKCLLCHELVERGKLIMLVAWDSNGLAYEGSYHYSCVEKSADDFVADDKYPRRFSLLRERIENGGRFFG